MTSSSCNSEEDPITPVGPTQNIVEIAQASGFNSLAAALVKTDLIGTLSGTTEYTVFAPTDEAFATLLAEIGQTSIDDVPNSVLEKILLYHVVPGSVLSKDISSGSVETAAGEPIALSTASGITVNGVAVISPFDVEATNGVIHTIGSVLVPNDIAQFVNTVLEPAYFNTNFTTLIEAAVKAGVVETLLTTPNLTIFAPNNEAFATSGIVPADLDAATLASVLTYHVVPAKVLSGEIPREAGTVNGGMIYFSLVDSGNFINGDYEITAVDIESGSGVVHVIDGVLLPASGNVVEKAIALSADGEFTSLIAALQRTADEGTAEQNLLNVLSSDGPFTVFAPTNAAFQALLDSNDSWATLSDIPLGTLVTVLTYHVVPARAFDKDIAGAVNAQNELPTAAGVPIILDLENLTINGNSKIIVVNQSATNGVIHAIDTVLLPQ
ncbi:hypothetical protein GCM10007940_02180 [Portibacter lacus]|uniref:FAS1 domain-containing protein n=2 Tax=Portibacter lacus TaxID=1099794 RepID=A0AA37SMW2_9BACT|nr:hypothetical protein GCM10007940_02180 [Portibacter lacus]